MTLHYAGKHRAARKVSPARRAGTGVAAAAALSVTTPLAVTALATPAMAQGGPTTPAASTQSTGNSSEAPAESPSADAGLLQRGDSGGDVAALQDKLGVTSDGVFGPDTEAAVEDVQEENGLTVDGIVGPQTRAALGGGAQGSGSDDSGDAQATTTSSDSGSDAGDAETTTASSDDGGSSDESVLDTAESLVGTPYTYGGETPEEGFDCSGFTMYVFAQHGMDLPRMTADQQDAVTPVSDPQPGDLVFFGDPAYHVGIYAGDGMMYDAGDEESDTSYREIWTDNVTYGRL